MEESLNSLVEKYNETGTGLDEICLRVTLLVYGFPKKNSQCSEEDCAEFYLSFHRRIKRLVDRYRYVGRNFETYLHSCLCWHMKSFIRRRICANRREKMLLQEGYFTLDSYRRDSEFRETSPGFFPEVPPCNKIGPFALSDRGLPKKQSELKQIILLALKSTKDLNDTSIEKLSVVSGIHRDLFFHFIEVLRLTMCRRTDRIRRLQDRRTRNFFRILCLLEERNHCSRQERILGLDFRIQQERLRFEKAGNDLSRVPKSPPHREIARILGIPKGSVDSCFYYLKKSIM